MPHKTTWILVLWKEKIGIGDSQYSLLQGICGFWREVSLQPLLCSRRSLGPGWVWIHTSGIFIRTTPFFPCLLSYSLAGFAVRSSSPSTVGMDTSVTQSLGWLCNSLKRDCKELCITWGLWKQLMRFRLCKIGLIQYWAQVRPWIF